MSLFQIREWIREQVREQHETNGGDVGTKGIAHAAAFMLAEDSDALDAVAETWCLAEAQRCVRDVRKAGKTVRALLIPNGDGTYARAGQLTLFSLREFALRQRSAGRSVAQLASQVIQIVDAAFEAGAEAEQVPEDVLTAEEMEAVYSLTRSSASAA